LVSSQIKSGYLKIEEISYGIKEKTIGEERRCHS